MIDTIIGVIVGGVIGSFIPLVTLFIEHYRWKRNAKLDYLKSERSRLEQLFNKTLKSLSSEMGENSYSSDTISDIILLMPKEISDRYSKFLDEKKKTVASRKLVYMELTVAMKKTLADIDKEIKELVS
jgi:gas vesicle protein